MSRSGYSDECEHIELWRGAVDRALGGARGQHFLRKLRDALDAMPVKRLIANAIADRTGEVCAMGAVDPSARVDPHDRDAVGRHFGIAPAMAAEIAYLNDECGERWEPEDVVGIGRRFRTIPETPEERWTRMRAWVEQQIVPEEQG